MNAGFSPCGMLFANFTRNSEFFRSLFSPRGTGFLQTDPLPKRLDFIALEVTDAQSPYVAVEVGGKGAAHVF
jgi:hypothetical protein